MPSTLLLDRTAWDLVVDARGNIAVAAEPYALAQDAASAIQTRLGTCFWDTSVGVAYAQILGKVVPISLLKQAFIDAALTVPNVVSAQVFISSLVDRTLRGQVQVASATGQTSAPTPFVAVNPQGAG